MNQAAQGERSALDYADLTEAFPEVDPGIRPFGTRVLVQIRSPKTRTKSGFILTATDQEVEKWNTQVAKVIAVGPVAYKNRDTLEPWPENDGNPWCVPGDFVRVPKYGGDKFEVQVPNSKEKALFALFLDDAIIGKITGNPLDMIAYLD